MSTLFPSPSEKKVKERSFLFLLKVTGNSILREKSITMNIIGPSLILTGLHEIFGRKKIISESEFKHPRQIHPKYFRIAKQSTN